MNETQKQLDELCRLIAKNLDDIIEGTYVNDENFPDPGVCDVDELSGHYVWSIADYLYDNYNMEYTCRVGNPNVIMGTSTCVALGGPNVYVKTDYRGNTYVEGYWGSDHSISWCSSEDIADEIEMLYDTLK